jgi:hypothetical protein
MNVFITHFKYYYFILIISFLNPLLLKSQDDCISKPVMKIVKQSFDYQYADYVYAIPNDMTVEKEATIQGVWGKDVTAYPNAQYKVMVGYVNNETEDAKMWGTSVFDNKFYELAAYSRAFNLSFTPPKDTIAHNFVKLQITCVAENQSNPSGHKFLVTVIYKIPLIVDIKGLVQYVGWDFDKKQYIHNPVVNQFANLLQGTNLVQWSKTSDKGCFSLNLPKDQQSYKLQILDNSGDVYFRVYNNIKPVQMDCWIPRILYNQSETMKTRLEKPTFVTDIFYGAWKPVTPLATNYFTTEVFGLVSDYCHFEGDYTKSYAEENDSVRSDKIIRALMAEILVDSVFQNTQKLSGETIKILTDACLALFYLKDFQKAIDSLTIKLGGKAIENFVADKLLNGAIIETSYRFIEDFIYNMKLTGSAKVWGEIVKNSFNVIKAGMTKLAGKDPKASIAQVLKDELIKNVVIWPANEIMLSTYVGFTQRNFENGVKSIKTSDYTGTNPDAQVSMAKVVKKNIDDIKTCVSSAKDKKMASNWLSTLAAIGLALIGLLALVFAQIEISLPAFLASATQIVTLIKSLSVATIVWAAIKLLLAVSTQGGVIDDGIKEIINPSEHALMIIQPEPRQVIKRDLIFNQNYYDNNRTQIESIDSNYLVLLDDCLKLANQKDISNLDLKFQVLNQEDKNMDNYFNKIQDNYYFIADSIITFNPQIDTLFKQFKELKQISNYNRILLGLYFIQQIYQTSPVPATDTLKMYADSVKRDLPALMALADQLLMELSKYKIPANIVLVENNHPSGLIKTCKQFNIGIKLKNIGSENSGPLVLKFSADSLTKILSDTVKNIDNFNPDETKDFQWNLLVDDSTKGTSIYSFYLIKNDSVILSESENVYFDSKTSATVVTGETKYSKCSINEIIPNPANNRASVNISLSDNHWYSTLSLIDVYGNDIIQYDLKFFNAGDYTINLDLNKLNSGVYFLRLITDNTVSNKQIVVIK